MRVLGADTIDYESTAHISQSPFRPFKDDPSAVLHLHSPFYL